MDEIAAETQRLLDIQISASGTHMEGSPMYEAQVAICLMRAIIRAEKSGYALPDSLLRAAKSMADYMFDLTGPDNCQLMIGDSDKTEMSSFFLLADYALKTDDYSARVIAPDDMTLLFDIPDALSDFLKKTGKPGEIPDHGFSIYDGENTAILRRNGFLIVGINGLHKSGHSHADSCEVIYAPYGQDLLIDCGRYSYVNCEPRRLLKGASAHNVLSFDDSPEWRAVDAWVYSAKTCDPKSAACSKDGVDCLKMTCKGKFGEGHEALFSRYVIFADESLLVVNIIGAAGSHDMRAFYNIDVKWRQSLDGGAITMTCDKGKVVLSSTGETSVEKAIASYGYNSLCDTVRCVSSKRFDGFGVTADFFGRAAEKISAGVTDRHVEVKTSKLNVRLPRETALTLSRDGAQDGLLVECDANGASIEILF